MKKVYDLGTWFFLVREALTEKGGKFFQVRLFSLRDSSSHLWCVLWLEEYEFEIVGRGLKIGTQAFHVPGVSEYTVASNMVRNLICYTDHIWDYCILGDPRNLKCLWLDQQLSDQQRCYCYFICLSDCTYQGLLYQDGERFEDPTNNCQTCQCLQGNVRCENSDCPTVCLNT